MTGDREQFLADLELVVDWHADLFVRLDRRSLSLELVNAWAGHEDLALEVRGFKAACRDLVERIPGSLVDPQTTGAVGLGRRAA